MDQQLPKYRITRYNYVKEHIPGGNKMEDKYVTKGYFKEYLDVRLEAQDAHFDAKLGELRSDIIEKMAANNRWLMGTLVAVAGVIIAALKLF